MTPTRSNGCRSNEAELRPLLLNWWSDHGRHDIPWKRTSSGDRPAPDQPLDPYPIWIAEVML
ncbi:MAG: A/G-specific adenine glycosylase, partial [Synechococcus sp. BS307-5m-G34]|nr:A/G-specific adenine glycosylase [Synechococcus sp. BS307-5m-G34]